MGIAGSWWRKAFGRWRLETIGLRRWRFEAVKLKAGCNSGPLVIEISATVRRIHHIED